MAKKNLSPMAAVGAAIVVSAALAPAVNATENPFAAEPLSAGYNLAAEEEGKCGEGKCGEEEEEEGKGDTEGKCGEGKCGG